MIGIIMGSQSDLAIMQQAADFLKSLDIPYELTIVSAHRTPERMFEYAKTAKERGLKVIIAGAGGAAHHQPGGGRGVALHEVRARGDRADGADQRGGEAQPGSRRWREVRR